MKLFFEVGAHLLAAFKLLYHVVDECSTTVPSQGSLSDIHDEARGILECRVVVDNSNIYISLWEMRQAFIS